MKLSLLFVFVLALLACDDTSRPVDPVWGKQPCAHCAMLVSDPRFGAELATESGDRFFFDDPGCMAAYVQEKAPRVRAMWVHQDGKWVDAKTARFQRAASPMDYGFAPAKDGAFDWSAVVAAVAARGGTS